MALHLNFAKATTMINLRMEYPIVADAILGRIIRNAYPIVLKDESMRKILTNCHIHTESKQQHQRCSIPVICHQTCPKALLNSATKGPPTLLRAFKYILVPS